jgi:hypothetical protein
MDEQRFSPTGASPSPPAAGRRRTRVRWIGENEASNGSIAADERGISIRALTASPTATTRDY